MSGWELARLDEDFSTKFVLRMGDSVAFCRDVVTGRDRRHFGDLSSAGEIENTMTHLAVPR